MADGFLRDGDEEGRSLLREKRKREEEPEAEEGSAEKLKPRKRKPTFDAERDAPKYWQEIGEQMTKLAPKITAAGTAFDKIMGELSAVKEDDKNCDPACVGYIRKLQHRVQLLWKFSGKRGVVKCFNLFKPEDIEASPVPKLEPDEALAVEAVAGAADPPPSAADAAPDQVPSVEDAATGSSSAQALRLVHVIVRADH